MIRKTKTPNLSMNNLLTRNRLLAPRADSPPRRPNS